MSILFLASTVVFIVSENTPECQQALGMQDGAITNGQLSASSEWDPNTHGVASGRLFFNSGSGSWVVRNNDANQWFQIDLISQSTKVTRVATQGRSIYCCQWVTKYKLQYSNNGVNFTYYKEHGQTTAKVTRTQPREDEAKRSNHPSIPALASKNENYLKTTRSMELPYILDTAFSQTDILLD